MLDIKETDHFVKMCDLKCDEESLYEIREVLNHVDLKLISFKINATLFKDGKSKEVEKHKVTSDFNVFATYIEKLLSENAQYLSYRLLFVDIW